MLSIAQYGLLFRRLIRDDIEMVRQWRNSPELRPYMHDTSEISAESQLKWFESVNNSHNFYFVIEYQSVPCGIVYLRNADYKISKAEGGILIHNTALHNSPVAAAALLFMLDFGFYVLGLQTIYGHVLKTNVRAEANYRRLGFRLTGSDERSFFEEATMDDYSQRATKMRDALQALTGEKTGMRIMPGNNPADVSLLKVMKGIIENSRPELPFEITLVR
jgi:RimJ/RimL family protein N-acetyltransferase